MEITTFLSKLFKKQSAITHKDIKKYSPASPQILEAGAANGIDTLAFSKLFPDGIIHAFEPVGKNYQILCSAVAKQKNVKTYQLALSDRDGETEIYVSRNTKTEDTVAASSSLLKPKEHLVFHPTIEFNTVEIVPTQTIDSWAQANSITKIDVMWLDMQGMEFKVLKSSPTILKTVLVLYTEVSLREMYEGAPLYKEYRIWLEQQGFKVVKEELPWEDMGNVLFVRK